MIWVAEIGSCHCGDKSLAYEMIRQAKKAGATIAKFQFGWNIYTQKQYHDTFNPVRFVDDWADDLKRWCDKLGIELMASIWSYAGLETARRIGMERYKIAHQLDDQALIEAMLSDKKEIFSSKSMLMDPLVKRIYCISEYPTYIGRVIPLRTYDFYYGYSSHAHGIADALMAVAAGAKYVEKHFTLDKTNNCIKDHSFAINPDEFRQMVDIGNEMEVLL